MRRRVTSIVPTASERARDERAASDARRAAPLAIFAQI
jgi:hypothetical protein